MNKVYFGDKNEDTKIAKAVAVEHKKNQKKYAMAILKEAKSNDKNKIAKVRYAIIKLLIRQEKLHLPILKYQAAFILTMSDNVLNTLLIKVLNSMLRSDKFKKFNLMIFDLVYKIGKSTIQKTLSDEVKVAVAQLNPEIDPGEVVLAKGGIDLNIKMGFEKKAIVGDNINYQDFDKSKEIAGRLFFIFGVVPSLIEESSKHTAQQYNFAKEYFIVFNAVEAGSYITEGLVAGGGLGELLKMRALAVGVHAGNTWLHKKGLGKLAAIVHFAWNTIFSQILSAKLVTTK